MVFDAMTRLRIPSTFVEHPRYAPPSGHTTTPYHWSKYKRVDKEQIRKSLESMVVLERELFEDSPEEDLQRIEHAIHFPWTSMAGYFIEDLVPEWLEELDVPRRVIPFLSGLYATSERLSGMLDEKKVAQEIQGLLEKINPEGTTVIADSTRETDLFRYRGSIFYLERRRNLGSQLYNTSHEVGFPTLYWGLVLANTKEMKPIAYTLLKDEGRTGLTSPRKLLLEEG